MSPEKVHSLVKKAINFFMEKETLRGVLLVLISSIAANSLSERYALHRARIDSASRISEAYGDMVGSALENIGISLSKQGKPYDISPSIKNYVRALNSNRLFFKSDDSFEGDEFALQQALFTGFQLSEKRDFEVGKFLTDAARSFDKHLEFMVGRKIVGPDYSGYRIPRPNVENVRAVNPVKYFESSYEEWQRKGR